MAGKTIVAFDLYGTLLSTESIAEQLEKHFGADTAQSISALWRRYQLEYTWRLNSMGKSDSLNDSGVAKSFQSDTRTFRRSPAMLYGMH